MTTTGNMLPDTATDKLREMSKFISITSLTPTEENKSTIISLDKEKIKEEEKTKELDEEVMHDGEGILTEEVKNENLDYSGNSEYIEDATGFEDISHTPMEIDESVGYGLEDYPIHYSDVIDDYIIDIDDDSKDNDPDFGQKKKKKRISSQSLLSREDQIKCRKITKLKIRECTDDLTKIENFEDNPNFAVVVDFIEKFGEHIGQKKIPIKDLQLMINARGNEAHLDLIKLHTNLLRKTKLPKRTLITKKTWENVLVLFCQTTGGMPEEGSRLQKVGYCQLNLSLKLEILKTLMESQFDWNERIRVLVDDLPAEILRYEPTGRDIDGKIYWTQVSFP